MPSQFKKVLTVVGAASLFMIVPVLADSEAGGFVYGGGDSESGGAQPLGWGDNQSGGVLWGRNESGGVWQSGAESDSGGAAGVGNRSESGGAFGSGGESAAEKEPNLGIPPSVPQGVQIKNY